MSDGKSDGKSDGMSDSKSDITSAAAPIKVIITCFGPFGGIPSNPTLSIVLESSPNISDLLNSNPVTGCIYETYELPVSTCGVDTSMSSIFSSSIETHPGPVIIIHCGVDGTQTSDGHFRLERIGFNSKDFRIPDNSGYQPKNEPIHSQSGDVNSWLGSMCGSSSSVCVDVTVASPSLDRCLKKLKENNWSNVKPSNSAGRFVCNYTHYTSLSKAAELNEIREEKVHGMFLHVPSFELIGEEEQGRFLRDLVQACVGEVGGEGGREVYLGPGGG